jgi:hypothetical protein
MRASTDPLPTELIELTLGFGLGADVAQRRLARNPGRVARSVSGG